MFGSGGGNNFSLSDIAAVLRGGNGNDGFGNNGWWILILLWAINGNGNLFGNRNNDNGNCNSCCNGSGGGGSVTYQLGADFQRGFDTQSIIQKLDGLNSGLCSLGYDQLSQMDGIKDTVRSSASQLQEVLNQLGIKQMQSENTISTLVQNKFCDLDKMICDLKYTSSNEAKDIITAINQAAQNIMANDNQNYRQLHDEQVQTQMQALKEANAAKDRKIEMLGLRDSQATQTNDIINGILSQLRNCPVGTYNVCNPHSESQLQQLINILNRSRGSDCDCGTRVGCC